MNDDQIAALAREYGEYVANSLDYYMYSNPEFRHKLAAKGHSESAQLVLEWLSSRYCLVEKSKVKQIYQAKQHILANQNVFGITVATEAAAQKRLMLCLFPEIGKEVEG